MKILKFLAKPFLWIEGRWSSRSKWFKRLVVVLFVVPSCLVVACSLLFVVGYNVLESFCEVPYVWDRKEVSACLRVDEYSDGKKKLYDKLEKEYIMDGMQWLSEVSDDDTLAVIAFPGKRGYINVHTAEMVIEPQYKAAWIFSEGLAAVRNQDGMVGFINKNNEVVIPFKFDAKDDGIVLPYVFKSGLCFMSDSIGLFGIIDRNGNWLIEPAYDYIEWHTIDGFRKVRKDGLYGLLDSAFNVVYEPIYQSVLLEEDQDRITLITDTAGCIVDYSGKVVVPFLYEDVEVLGYPISMSSSEENGYYHIESAVSDYAKYKINYEYGLLNAKTGKIITPAIYSTIEMISPTLFSVSIGGYWQPEFLIDTKGNVVK